MTTTATEAPEASQRGNIRNELSDLPRYDGYNSIAISEGSLIVVGAQDTEKAGESMARFRRLGPDGAVADETFLPEDASSAGFADIVRLSDGDVVAVGWRRASGAAADDCWAVRADRDGERRWSTKLGGQAHERCYFATLLPNGDLLVGGRSDEDATGKGAAYGATWRLDSTTGAVRSRGENLTRCDRCRRSAFQDAVSLPDGGVLLVGWATHPTRGDDDVWLVKRDRDGDVLWERRIGGPGPDLATAALTMPPDGVVVLGYTTQANAKATSGLVLALRSDGGTVWSREIDVGTGGNDKLYAGTLDADGTLVAVGAASEDAKAPLQGWVVRLARDGSSKDERLIGDPPGGRLLAVDVLPGHGLVAAGTAHGPVSGDVDGWIVRLDPSAPGALTSTR